MIDNSSMFSATKKNHDLPISYYEHEAARREKVHFHTGIEKATGEVPDHSDADLEYDPREYNDLLETNCRRLRRRGVRITVQR
ncbi:MAG: hypothetical protein R2813_11185 [Flavobacteriales bacterium]